jgi:hypothetical protein
MTLPPPSERLSSLNESYLDTQSMEAARERAVRVLTDAFAYDVITDTEFERRLSLLGQATGALSVDAVVADLPGGGSLRRQAPSYETLIPPAGRIVGFMSETRRRGAWRVPRELSLRAVMCDMKIDLRAAAVPPGCEIRVKAIMSSVSIIVPPGMTVDFMIDPILGSARSDADESYRGASHVRVIGTAIMAEVSVRTRALGR